MADKGRRDDPLIFFIYDHNMLKKEEDDLKDAILYFTPEDMPADDQCALCGQLMGMSEFLSATISKSTPKLFRFEHRKFALKRIGSYSLGVHGGSFTPDFLLKKQLKRMYASYVTYHGSIDSLRLRFRESHSAFLQELANIWRSILAVSGITTHMSLSNIFGAIPYVDLPKSGAHLFLQASHLLQSCQRRPYVMAGTILYKNGVLCTQLPPVLTRHLTLLQNQMPHISRTLEFDLPVGCKIVTLFLTDKQLEEICPLDPHAKRHCKVADFRGQRNREDSPCSDAEACTKSKNFARRLTCPNLGSINDRKSGISLSEKAMNNFIKNEQRKSYQHKQETMAVDQLPWKKTKPKVILSHVPIVECRSGESPLGLEHEVLGHAAKNSHFGQRYTELDVSEDGKEDGEASETDNSDMEQRSHGQDKVQDKPVIEKSDDKKLKHSDISKGLNHSAIDTNKSESFETILSANGANVCVEKVSDIGSSVLKKVQVEKEDEEIGPSISDLEDDVNSSNRNTNKSSIEYERSGSFETYESDKKILSNEIDKVRDVKKLEKDLNEMCLTESSVEIDKRNYGLSDDRTVTISKTAYHAVLHHKADVHTEAAESTHHKANVHTEAEESTHHKANVHTEAEESTHHKANVHTEAEESTHHKADVYTEAEESTSLDQGKKADSTSCNTDNDLVVQSVNDEDINVEDNKENIFVKEQNLETKGNDTVAHSGNNVNVADNKESVFVKEQNLETEGNDNVVQHENDKVNNVLNNKERLINKEKDPESEGNENLVGSDEVENDKENNTNKEQISKREDTNLDEIDSSSDGKSKGKCKDHEEHNEERIPDTDGPSSGEKRFSSNFNSESKDVNHTFIDNCDKKGMTSDNINDTIKSNINPNVFLEESVDNVDYIEESEQETEDESVRIRNENPCINCLELLSVKGNKANNVRDTYCAQCLAKVSQSLMFGNQEHQEVIDFRKKPLSPDSGTETEDVEKDKAETLDEHKAGLIASSFSSDVSTDSTMSRYWTQEMDGLTDVTLYVQCHSDISLFLVLENPNKYQENLFHALWKGSLAQLADLDYYIKECLDIDDTDNKQDIYKYARFDNFQNRLEGNMLETPEGTLESVHQHHMLATMHAEFNQHPCLSDVVLRSQLFSCYGHQNQMDETYFQPSAQGPWKPSSGLPIPRDPVFSLDQTAKLRLSKDRKLSMI